MSSHEERVTKLEEDVRLVREQRSGQCFTPLQWAVLIFCILGLVLFR